MMVIPTLILVSLSWMKYRGLEYVLINYRWIFVIFFLMPASLLYDLIFYVRNWIVFSLNSAPHKHDEKVEDVKRQVNTNCKQGSIFVCDSLLSNRNQTLRSQDNSDPRYFGTSAEVMTLRIPKCWYRNVLGLKCLGSEMSWDRIVRYPKQSLYLWYTLLYSGKLTRTDTRATVTGTILEFAML